MLRWRLILGAVFIAVLVGLLWWDHSAGTSNASGDAAHPGLALFPLAILLAWLGADEFVKLANANGRAIHKPTVVLGSVAIVAMTAIPGLVNLGSLSAYAWSLLALFFAVLAVFIAEMRRYESPGKVTERLGVSILGIVYVGGLLSCVANMRLLGPGGSWGVPAIASLVIVVKAADIGAFTIGKLFGKHKMTPVLSPGKTWEGAGGAFLFGCAASWIAFEWLLPAAVDENSLPRFFPLAWLVYGALITLLGVLGDLAESLLKRDAGRKDSSEWMPGFGGVLDILDSILFAAPAAWAFWLLLG